VIEARLIEELAEVRGGRGRLEKIRSECYDEIDRLRKTIEQIDTILSRGEVPDEEMLDSPGE